MGCNCGGGGSGLGNYEVKDATTGKVVKTFTAVRETEAKAFAAKTPNATWRKTS